MCSLLFDTLEICEKGFAVHGNKISLKTIYHLLKPCRLLEWYHGIVFYILVISPPILELVAESENHCFVCGCGCVCVGGVCVCVSIVKNSDVLVILFCWTVWKLVPYHYFSQKKNLILVGVFKILNHFQIIFMDFFALLLLLLLLLLLSSSLSSSLLFLIFFECFC